VPCPCFVLLLPLLLPLLSSTPFSSLYHFFFLFLFVLVFGFSLTSLSDDVEYDHVFEFPLAPSSSPQNNNTLLMGYNEGEDPYKVATQFVRDNSVVDRNTSGKTLGKKKEGRGQE
jgi:hypothetical protein